MREKLIELLDMNCGYVSEMKAEELADYLLQNGIVVLQRDGNDFNPDLYCPYCGNNLSATAKAMTKKMTNYEKIKTMDIIEMTKFIFSVLDSHCREHCRNVKCNVWGSNCRKGIKQWLHSEVDE